MREVPDNVDPYEDQFAKAANIKKENIAKNEFQRLRNIARNSNVRLPSMGVSGNKFARPKDVSTLNVVSPLVSLYKVNTMNIVWVSVNFCCDSTNKYKFFRVRIIVISALTL